MYGFSINSNIRSKLVGSRRVILVLIGTRYYCSRVLVWCVHTRRTLCEANQGCGVVSCATCSYWGACCSKVVVLIWYMYVREDRYFWFFIEIFFFFGRYLVVGSRYDFFSVSIARDARPASRILFDTKQNRENSRVRSFEVRVMLLLDRSRAWMILAGRQLWIACGHTTVVYHS